MTPDEQQELMCLCEDIHAMMAKTGKAMDKCIVIYDRIVDAQTTWEAEMRAKHAERFP